eukprot:1156822-Pelagomonas_calceolata.AAC.4
MCCINILGLSFCPSAASLSKALCMPHVGGARKSGRNSDQLAAIRHLVFTCPLASLAGRQRPLSPLCWRTRGACFVLIQRSEGR